MDHDSADSATVVVTQVVLAGREADYKLWQQRTIDAAREFEGFEGATMYPPSSPEVREWVVVYRFASLEKLNVWAQSEQQRRLLNEGRPYFESPPTPEVLVGKPPPRDVVTAFAAHDVIPGKEREFKRWQDKLHREQEKFPGFMGGELFRPVAGIQDQWVSLFRYDTQEHLEAWLESESRAKLLHEGRKYVRSFELHMTKSAFSGWFASGDTPTVPGWKQAMAVLLALFPTLVIIAYSAGPVFAAMHVTGPLAVFISLVVAVAILTWVLMPLVNRALAFWLVPRGVNPPRTDVIGAGLIVLCYAALIIIAIGAFA